MRDNGFWGTYETEGDFTAKAKKFLKDQQKKFLEDQKSKNTGKSELTIAPPVTLSNFAPMVSVLKREREKNILSIEGNETLQITQGENNIKLDEDFNETIIKAIQQGQYQEVDKQLTSKGFFPRVSYHQQKAAYWQWLRAQIEIRMLEIKVEQYQQFADNQNWSDQAIVGKNEHEELKTVFAAHKKNINTKFKDIIEASWDADMVQSYITRMLDEEIESLNNKLPNHVESPEYWLAELWYEADQNIQEWKKYVKEKMPKKALDINSIGLALDDHCNFLDYAIDMYFMAPYPEFKSRSLAIVQRLVEAGATISSDFDSWEKLDWSLLQILLSQVNALTPYQNETARFLTEYAKLKKIYQQPLPLVIHNENFLTICLRLIIPLFLSEKVTNDRKHDVIKIYQSICNGVSDRELAKQIYELQLRKMQHAIFNIPFAQASDLYNGLKALRRATATTEYFITASPLYPLEKHAELNSIIDKSEESPLLESENNQFKTYGSHNLS